MKECEVKVVVDVRDRFKGAMLGLACGDATGASLEFKVRDKLPPLTGMKGGGKFKLQAGEWTDDTSMALCLAESLTSCNGFDAKDQMIRYMKWADEGYYSCKPYAFGIGKTVIQALGHFSKTGEAYSGSVHSNTAGNGSIMRLAPVVLYFFPDYENVINFSGESSRTTHQAAECIQACQILAHILFGLLDGQDKNDVLDSFDCWDNLVSDSLLTVIRGDYKKKRRDEIISSGYVVYSLEAALWCFLNSDSAEEAILLAANLADDADTVAAICGQLAGAHYGFASLPNDWLVKLAMNHKILELADALYLKRA